MFSLISEHCSQPRQDGVQDLVFIQGHDEGINPAEITCSCIKVGPGVITKPKSNNSLADGTCCSTADELKGYLKGDYNV